MTGQGWVDSVRYALGTLLAISLPPAVAYWFVVHPFIGLWRRLGLALTVCVLGIFLVGSAAILYHFRAVLLGRDLGFHPLLLVPALACIVVSSLVRRKRSRFLSFKTLVGVPEIAPETQGIGLLTEGIYGRIRHPRYVEFALAGLGWAFVVNFLGVYVLAAIVIAALLVIVEIEERELARRFGPAYESYRARVPRFFPRRRA
jgi:protein-S-isoprenylcysteine O-methyltransferase Ste14